MLQESFASHSIWCKWFFNIQQFAFRFMPFQNAKSRPSNVVVYQWIRDRYGEGQKLKPPSKAHSTSRGDQNAELYGPAHMPGLSAQSAMCRAKKEANVKGEPSQRSTLQRGPASAQRGTVQGLAAAAGKLTD